MANNFFFAQDNANKQDLILKNQTPSPKRSVFPYGISKIIKLNEGAIVPVDLVPIIPGDSLDLDLIMNITSNNPFVERMFSGMQVFIHCFYQKNEHEWLGWKNYATEGRRGNIKLSLPQWNSMEYYNLRLDGYVSNFTGQCCFDTPGSLAAYMFNLAFYQNDNMVASDYGTIGNYKINNVALTSLSDLDKYGLGVGSQNSRCFRVFGHSSSTTPMDIKQTRLTKATNPQFNFNAIPLSTYQRIYRDFYSPKNLFMHNPFWFPDNEDDFVLPYAPTNNRVASVGNSYYSRTDFSLVPNDYTASSGTQQADSPALGCLRYRQFEGDIFTTGLPFLERGGVTKQWNMLIGALNVNNQFLVDKDLYKTEFTNRVNQSTPSYSSATQAIAVVPPSSSNVASYAPATSGQWGSSTAPTYDAYTAVGSPYGIFQTMNQLRELSVMTLWSERNARCDGSYNELIRAHYGINPNSEDRSARYLGGSRLRIQFDNVVQQSENGNTPLGQKVSTAYGSGMAHIGHFEFNDFGFIHVYASILPDTFYNQGCEPWIDGEMLSADLPYPEFTSLPRGELTVRRIFADSVSGNLSLFAYQERFLDYKYRQSRLSGGMLNYLDDSTRAMTFSRIFDEAPVFNSEFVTASPYNLRDDMYSSPKDWHWVAQFADSIRLVRCLPYVNKEADLAHIA